MGTTGAGRFDSRLRGGGGTTSTNNSVTPKRRTKMSTVVNWLLVVCVLLCFALLSLVPSHYVDNSSAYGILPSSNMFVAAETSAPDDIPITSDGPSEGDTQSAAKQNSKPKYDPYKCNNMYKGHCRDEDGGAWSYRKDDGSCTHSEQRVPKDRGAVEALPKIFPDVQSGVLDFGGGVGAYLTSFRDAGVTDLVIMEPRDLGDCLFQGLTQVTTDLINTPLSDLPKHQYDLVMTVEVCEHFPVEYHPHVIEALTQASRKWLLFSAAHPGQPGEGHVGPSMTWRKQWIKEISDQTNGEWVLDQDKTDALHKASIFSLLKQNAFIMRRKSPVMGGDSSTVPTGTTATTQKEQELRLRRR